MSGTELKVLEIIWDYGGEASINTITREARISADYARLICQSLERNNHIGFLRSKLCVLKGKGKLEAAKRMVDKQRSVTVSKKTPKFGYKRDKKGRFILEY